MVKQGDIISVDLNPRVGHEQSGFRPAVVVSKELFHRMSSMTIVCPITNTIRDFPLHVQLDDRTVTTGNILCEQVRAIDLRHRKYKVIEKLPKDILLQVIDCVQSSIDLD